MKQNQLFPISIILITLLFACKNDFFDPEVVSIRLDNPEINKSLSDVFEITGFTSLQVNDLTGIDRVRHFNKILVNDGVIYVLDNKSDFKNIWRFDAASGKRLGQFDFKNNPPDGLHDFTIYKDGSVTCLAAAKRSFMNFSPAGTYTSSLNNGIIGDLLVRSSNGGYWVYNEYSATDISGFNQLIYYDSKGNLLKRLYPYNKNLDNIAYSFSGFLSGSNNRIWFSPPFCDTVYEIRSNILVPKYTFDFGSFGVPYSLRTEKLASGWDVDKYHYLTEKFIKLNNGNIVFEFYADRKVHLGLFNEDSKTYQSFSDSKEDQIKTLLSYGNIFPKDENTFLMFLSSARIKYLLKNKHEGLEKLGELYPDLSHHLLSLSGQDNPNPLLIYIAVKG